MQARVRRLASRLRRAFANPRPAVGPAILMYHRVVDIDLDPWNLAVSPALFEQQMARLQTERSPLPLTEFVQRLTDRTIPENAVAVTFDDGYLDNLLVAKPILMRHGVPATLFLATGFVGQVEDLWWDELAKLVMLNPAGPAVASETAALLSPSAAPPADGALDPLDTYRRLWSILQISPLAQVHQTLAILRERLGPAPRGPFDRMMTAAEVGAWLEGGLTTIEPHTVTHPLLTSLTAPSVATEVGESVRACAEISGTPPTGFAYPYGGRNDAVAQGVRAAGLRWACSTRHALIDHRQPLDLFDLPRLQVTNASGSRPWQMH